MPTFGVAAFLKVASLNPKPRKTELRKRLFPSGDGYDFHRRLKLASNKHMVAGEGLAALLEYAGKITPLPERKAMVAGLTKLGLWRDGVTGDGFKPQNKIYESSRGIFKIAFQPEFGLKRGSERLAFHVWNTKRPELESGAIYSTLALMSDVYAEDDDCPDDFGILSLHEPKAYLLSDAAAARTAWRSMVDWVEELMLDIRSEESGLGEVPEDRPPPW